LILEGDQSSRLYQRLVKEKQLSLDWGGSIYWGLGNEFDYSGPMLLTMTGIYKQGVSAEDLITNIDAVIADISKNGVSEKELNDAVMRFRSSYYDQLENHVSRAHLLATFALFKDQPERINTVLDPFLKVKPADVQAAATKYLVPTNRTIIDRVPAQGGK
jgi:zinc protease